MSKRFKNRKTIYRHLPPKNMAEPKTWYLVHVNLIGPYSKCIVQHQPGGSIIKNKVSLFCIMIIDPATGWFGIFGIPTYDLDEVAGVNDEYIDKSSSRVSQLFNTTCLS